MFVDLHDKLLSYAVCAWRRDFTGFIVEYGTSPECKSWPPTDDQRGVVCRWCGCTNFRVVHTRPTWGGRIMRRRECRYCGKRMTTWEKPGG